MSTLIQARGADDVAISQPLRILLIDDHPAVRLGMGSLITQVCPNAQITESCTATAGLQKLREQTIDLVFLDLKLAETEGEEIASDVGKHTLQRIRAMDGPPVVIMTGESTRDRGLVEEIMSLGAATFVPKSTSVELTLEAIRRAVTGGIWLPPEMLGKGGDSPPQSREALRAPLPRPITHQELGITQRQFDVLHLALSGFAPIRIAAILQINHDNVRRKMSRLYEHFGTADLASLHAYFARTGKTLGVLRAGQIETHQSSTQ
jgi:DNA-binding NarL/FixJ family response regulator